MTLVNLKRPSSWHGNDMLPANVMVIRENSVVVIVRVKWRNGHSCFCTTRDLNIQLVIK